MWLRSCLLPLAATFTLVGYDLLREDVPEPPPRLSWGQTHTFADGTTVRIAAPVVHSARHCLDYDMATGECHDPEQMRAVRVDLDAPGRLLGVEVDGRPVAELYPDGHIDLAPTEHVYAAPSRPVDMAIRWSHDGQTVVFTGIVPAATEVAA